MCVCVCVCAYVCVWVCVYVHASHTQPHVLSLASIFLHVRLIRDESATWIRIKKRTAWLILPSDKISSNKAHEELRFCVFRWSIEADSTIMLCMMRLYMFQDLATWSTSTTSSRRSPYARETCKLDRANALSWSLTYVLEFRILNVYSFFSKDTIKL